MARTAKTGLEYFPFDIDFFQDIRIRKLIKRQGGKAVTVYALLLCLIYKNGYYMQWDDELPFIGSEMSGCDQAFISEVINICLMLGLFSKEMFDNERVLTSKGIQVRYCDIQRLNRRLAKIDRYSLLPDDAPRHCSTSRKTKKPTGKTKKPTDNTSLKQEPASTASASSGNPVASPQNNAEWLAEFFNDSHRESLLVLCKNFGVGKNGISCLRSLAEAVVNEWELSHTSHRDYSDWSRHLISAMRIKHRDAAPVKNDLHQQSAPPASDYSFKGGFGGQDV